MPATMLDFLTPEYYQRIARTLEEGKIQMAFLDDRLALPDIYTGHHAEAIGAGVRAGRQLLPSIADHRHHASVRDEGDAAQRRSAIRCGSRRSGRVPGGRVDQFPGTYDGWHPVIS
jgi:hypothetical protein